MNAIETVRIGDHDVQAVRDEGGEGYVVLRRMCEVLGIDPKAQQDKIKESSWATGVLIPSVAEDGKTRNLFCLHVKSVPMWLSGIDAGRVSESARPTLERFQREAADVLYRWSTGQTMQPESFEASVVRVLGEAQRRLESQSRRLAIAEPKAEAFDKYVDAPGFMSLREMALHLKRHQNELIAELIEKGYLYRQRTRDPNRTVLKAYSKWIDAGLFVLRLVPGHEHPQVIVTTKGLAYFAQLSLAVEKQERAELEVAS